MTQPLDDAACPRRFVPAGADPDVRQGLVARVRHEIALGVYETEEKWAIAVDRLIDDVEAMER
ncbi:MAG TPA: hypothetical protein PKD86_06715 [Gemmatales bacterium]|nr:hypothetical protein [Gemmatales bacterium]HMP59029.1 hypothetical protein [Gemmatales bacterium]